MAISAWIHGSWDDEDLGPLPPEVLVQRIPTEGPLPAGLREAELLVPPARNREVLELFAEMPALRVIQTVSAGTDRLEPFVPEGVVLCNARGTRDIPVAEWALAAILQMERELPAFADDQRRHRWRSRGVTELAGKRALIVGYGSIGRELGRMLVALGVEVEGVVSQARDGLHGAQELPRLLPAFGIVVVLLPLTEATRGLFDAHLLSRMAPGALLVNAGRGPLVDTTGLLAAIEARGLRAALDVTDPEPLPAEHPLWDAPGVMLTPHMAGDSPQATRRVHRFVGDQIRRYAAGEPLLNVVPLGARRV